MNIRAENIKKVFNQYTIFENINFDLKNGDSFYITGKNGSGKSTLVRIVSGLFEPTGGKMIYRIKEKEIDTDEVFRHIGFVSPYLNLYDEFSAHENLELFDKILGFERKPEYYDELLDFVQLLNRKNDLLGTYSSGMKQRLKYAFALLSNPEVLILDEPTSNLDSDGIEMVHKVIEKQKSGNKILVIATNERSDLKYCEQGIDLSKR